MSKESLGPDNSSEDTSSANTIEHLISIKRTSDPYYDPYVIDRLPAPLPRVPGLPSPATGLLPVSHPDYEPLSE